MLMGRKQRPLLALAVLLATAGQAQYDVSVPSDAAAAELYCNHSLANKARCRVSTATEYDMRPNPTRLLWHRAWIE